MATPTQPRPPADSGPRVASRRPLAAGNVIVVMLVAALVGGMLNAAGIRKTANGQPVGVRRDVARFFAEPLYDVSHALRIDQLRRGLQAVTGRSGNDDINASLPDPIAAADDADPTTATTQPPKKRSFSPENRLTVWVGGDSLSIVPGQSFVNLAPGAEIVDVVGNTVDGQVATGLARPEAFNWAERMNDVVAQDQPDAVVITIGSNDDQTLTGEGGVGPYASPEWITEYRRRVGGLMDQVTGTGERVLFWLGTPPIRTRADDRYNTINDIYREEAAKRRGRVVFIDLDSRYRGSDGGYADFIDGVQVRTPDGVHFNRAGGDQVARIVLDTMSETFDLTSWRGRGATTTTTTTTTTTATTATTTEKPTATTRAKAGARSTPTNP